MFYTNKCRTLPHPENDPTQEQLLCVEFGAKIQSEKVHFEFGGGAGNTAVNFARLGIRTGILTSIGYDLDGRAMKEHFEAEGIRTQAMCISQKNRSGFSFLVVDERSGEHTAYVYYGAARDMQCSASQLQRNPAQWYYITSLNTPQWPALMTTLCAQRNVLRAWNPGAMQIAKGLRGCGPFMARMHLLNVNKDEASELLLSDRQTRKHIGSVQEMLRALRKYGPAIVLITDGRAGAYAYDGKKIFFVRPKKHTPVDTTGAGDCFGSSFVAGLIKFHGDVQRALDLAAVTTVALVKKVGAQQGLLRWKELPQRLRQL